MKFTPWIKLNHNIYNIVHSLPTTHHSRQGFWYFARSRSREIQVNPWNPVKFTKTRKVPQNLVEILSNTCLYNIFETYFSYRGYLLAVNLQIYLGTSLPADVLWGSFVMHSFLPCAGRNECVTNEPHRTSAGRLSWNFVSETCKQHPETTSRRLCCEKLGTSHDVKGFAVDLFLERIVVERANDDLC